MLAKDPREDRGGQELFRMQIAGGEGVIVPASFTQTASPEGFTRGSFSQGLTVVL